MRLIKVRRIVYVILVAVTLITIPLLVYAETNHGGSDAGGETGGAPLYPPWW